MSVQPDPKPNDQGQALYPHAKIIADSISPHGDRLVTVEGTLHRFLLAELNTHRVFSRNSASSRAIPVHKQIAKVVRRPAMPLVWGLNQPGMQASGHLEGEDALKANYIWVKARGYAVQCALELNELGVHKQLTNRLLEPFMEHTVIISSTDWQGFFDQRCTPEDGSEALAQPEIVAFADAVRDAIRKSHPARLNYGEWHLPYVSDDEWRYYSVEVLKKISVARCARVSYLTHDGKRDVDADLALFERLSTASPPHASPLEHVATPRQFFRRVGQGNFYGWNQLRHKYFA